MSEETGRDAVLESLCERQRELEATLAALQARREAEIAQVDARLDEVRDMIARIRGPRRGRPRSSKAVRQIEDEVIAGHPAADTEAAPVAEPAPEPRIWP